MNTDNELSRRYFLSTAGAAAILGAISAKGAFAANEPAQTTDSYPGAGGGLDYCSTRELGAMLAARQISAGELVENVIARVEGVDHRINALVGRAFWRAP